MSVTTAKGNQYILVYPGDGGLFFPMEACPLPDKMALAHSDQGREFDNKVIQELCFLCGAHKTRTTPYHPESDGLVEHFNRTLLMMLTMFAGENRDDLDDLLTAVMMAYRSSIHESTGFSLYWLIGRHVHCLWMSVFRGRNRTCRTR